MTHGTWRRWNAHRALFASRLRRGAAFFVFRRDRPHGHPRHGRYHVTHGPARAHTPSPRHEQMSTHSLGLACVWICPFPPSSCPTSCAFVSLMRLPGFPGRIHLMRHPCHHPEVGLDRCASRWHVAAVGVGRRWLRLVVFVFPAAVIVSSTTMPCLDGTSCMLVCAFCKYKTALDL